MNKQYSEAWYLFKAKSINNIRSKDFQSIFWGTMEALIYPALMLLATPYFINKLGVEQYGIWMLVNTIIMSIGILNIGLGDATIKFVAEYKSKGDRNGMINVIKSTYSVYLVLSFLVFLLSIFISLLVSWGYLFDLSENNKTIAVAVIPIAGLTLALRFLEQVFLGVFKGQGLYPLASKISIVGKISVIIFNVCMVVFNQSIVHIFISTVFVTACVLLIEVFMISKTLGFFVFLPTFNKIYIKKIFSFGIWTWFLSVLGLLSVQIDKFFVISLTDVTVFAFYSVGFMIFTQIHNVFSASTSWIFPMVTDKINKNENLYAFYKSIQIKLLIAVTILLTGFMLIEGYILPLWLNPNTYNSAHVFIQLFVCLNFIMASTIMPYYFLNGSGLYRLNTYFNILTLISRIIFIPLGFHFFGINGLIYGLIMASLLMVPVQIVVFHSKVLNDHNWLMAIKFVIPFLLFMIGFKINHALFFISSACLSILYTRYFLFNDKAVFE